MKILLATTENFIRGNRTALAANAAAGSSVVVAVSDATGFNVADYVVIGNEGGSNAELCKISAVTADSITIITLVQAHLNDEPVVVYRYNQRKFYGSITQTGSYTELTSYGSPVTIGVNDPQGATLEYTGTEGYLYFKSTYYNATTTAETALVDANAVLADESTRYCTLYSIRKMAGLTDNPFMTDGTLEVYRKRAENEINSYIYDRYILPLTNITTNLPEVPGVIENACTLLAAGYLDYREYGQDGQGVKWLGEARGLLSAIRKGSQRLIGTDSQEMIQKLLTQGVQSYPNTVDNTNGPTEKFSMDQVF